MIDAATAAALLLIAVALLLPVAVALLLATAVALLRRLLTGTLLAWVRVRVRLGSGLGLGSGLEQAGTLLSHRSLLGVTPRAGIRRRVDGGLLLDLLRVRVRVRVGVRVGSGFGSGFGFRVRV